LVRVNLLAILVITNARRRSTVAATLTGADADNLAVNGAADTVLQLQVHLGNCVFWEYGGVRDITCAVLAFIL